MRYSPTCITFCTANYLSICYIRHSHRGNSTLTDGKYYAIQWRHNEHDGVSNHQPQDLFLNRLFRRRSKKHQSSALLAFVRGIDWWPVRSPHKGPVTRKIFPFHDVIMIRQHYVGRYAQRVAHAVPVTQMEGGGGCLPGGHIAQLVAETQLLIFLFAISLLYCSALKSWNLNGLTVWGLFTTSEPRAKRPLSRHALSLLCINPNIYLHFIPSRHREMTPLVKVVVVVIVVVVVVVEFLSHGGHWPIHLHSQCYCSWCFKYTEQQPWYLHG